MNKIAILAFLLLIVSSQPSFAAESRHALVIGNADYKDLPLSNPVNDARDISAVLRTCGFQVTTLTNVKRSEMRRGVKDFMRRIKKGGVGLFYYAGHGIQVDGINYLVPVDSDVTVKIDIEDQCLKANYIMAAMEEAGNRLNIIILDACRTNPFRSFRAIQSGLAQMDAPSGSILAFATAPGSVSSDGKGKNGLYTEKLLKHLATPGLRLTEMFMQVRTEVMGVTGGVQTPWENHSLTSPFYMIPTGVAPQVQPNIAASPSSGVAVEMSFWESVEKDGSLEMYQAYLDTYPNGVFAALARTKIDMSSGDNSSARKSGEEVVRRIDLVDRIIHIGDDVASDFNVRNPYGKQYTIKFTIDEPVAKALLIMSVSHVVPKNYHGYKDGKYQDVVEVNGYNVGVINEHVEGTTDSLQPVVVSMPIDIKLLRRGENYIRVSAGSAPNLFGRNYDDFEIRAMVLEYLVTN